MANFQTIIEPAEVAGSSGDIKLLDCRAKLGEPHYGLNAYNAGHIPGAVHADLDQHLAAPAGKRGRHPLPERNELLAACRNWGLNDTDQVVVYDDASGAFAARAWWLLRWLGHANVAVLNGGLDAWEGPLEKMIPDHPAGNFSDRHPLTRVVDARSLLEPSHIRLVDARARARYEGLEEPIDHTAGHIPGAICHPFSENLGKNGRFLSPEELAQRFAGWTEDTVCYCGSGVTAAHNILAMRIAGLAEPALYPGSWSEWIEDPSRPIATGA